MKLSNIQVKQVESSNGSGSLIIQVSYGSCSELELLKLQEYCRQAIASIEDIFFETQEVPTFVMPKLYDYSDPSWKKRVQRKYYGDN